MTFSFWFLFFLGLISTHYFTFKIGFIKGAIFTDEVIDFEIEKRWDKLKEDKRIEEEEEMRKFHMGFAYKPNVKDFENKANEDK